MRKTKPQSKLVPFDAARYLTDDAAVAEYMTAVLETEDPDLLLLALADVARARGMAQVAKEAGLGRESLYKALAPGAKPRFDTVLKVARALGVRLTAHPVWQSGVKPNPSIQRTGRQRSATSSSVLARR
jgi:probable addiction module antidote protein